MNEPNWAKDIQSYVDKIPYGKVQVTVVRAANKTIQIHTESAETTRHEENQAAIKELTTILEALGTTEYDGTITFTASFKKGRIKEIAHYNVKQTNY